MYARNWGPEREEVICPSNAARWRQNLGLAPLPPESSSYLMSVHAHLVLAAPYRPLNKLLVSGCSAVSERGAQLLPVWKVYSFKILKMLSPDTAKPKKLNWVESMTPVSDYSVFLVPLIFHKGATSFGDFPRSSWWTFQKMLTYSSGLIIIFFSPYDAYVFIKGKLP